MKIKIGVIFGGNSTEHEISIISALQATEHIDKNKYDVIPIYISKDSKFYIGENVGNIDEYKNIPNLISSSSQVALINDSNKVIIIKYPYKMFSKNIIDTIDIAFPIVHGTNVEDGTLQGFLESLSIPYVGSDVMSSALGMDKYFSKIILKNAGINCLDALLFTKYEFYSDQGKIINEIEDKFTYPVIVKPNNLGSSIGISVVKNSDEALSSLEEAFSYSEKVLVERAVTNLREINCAVLGDMENAIASECERPLNHGEILSFEDKYMSNSGFKNQSSKSAGTMANFSRILPADISSSDRSIIRNMAIEAFKTLGCSGVARVDFIIDMDDSKIYFNEINTIPGSLSFYLWKGVGIEYPDLLDKLINLALKRNRKRKDTTFSFETNVLSKVNLKGSKHK